MNLATDRICPNEPDIASKIIDGEAILINLRTGAYYSLRDAGAALWLALCGHRTQRELVQAVGAHFSEPPASLELDISEILAELAAENLIRASSDHHVRELSSAGAVAPSPEYQKPSLEKFTDMEELLALDPPTPGALDGLMRRPLD